MRTHSNVSVHSRSNWNLEGLVIGGKTSQSKGENQQQTQPTYGVDARIRTRATLMGGEREIRLLREQDEGLKNTCSSSRIHFLWLFLLVDELPNESVERNNQIFSNLIH